ncbi:MAG: FAD-linked oxidase C-terminal domain-containing protein [Legionellales bacterium]|jgi:D-lactate dehydrogenase
MNPKFLTQLKAHLSDEFFFTDPEKCWPYGSDSTQQFFMPDAVVFPQSHEDVVFITRLCNEYKIPMVARGLGSGTVGGALPIQAGIVMSMVRMNEIISLDTANRVMIAQPGITNFAIQTAAGKHGLFWAPDPGSREFCSLGGNLAHNASGPRAIKYGTVRENVLALKAVTGEGNTINTGAYTTKSVVGYDLTRLLIGSEGTLATITQATLKLLPLPQKQMTLRALYKNITGATHAITAIMGQAELPAALEFMDKTTVELVRKYGGIALPNDVQALLLIGIDGNENNIYQILEIIKQAAKNPDLITIEIANTEQEVHQLWQARRRISPSLRYVAPKKINEDIVVPVSRIPELISGLEKLSNQYGITIVSFGHAGNGNIHVNLMYDPANEKQAAHIDQCLQDVFTLVLTLKGSLSGEHGIGVSKQAFLSQEVDENTLSIMRNIKKVFDPNNILNPRKIFPC